MVARCISAVQQVRFLRSRNADASYRFIILVNRRSRLHARHSRVTGMTRRGNRARSAARSGSEEVEAQKRYAGEIVDVQREDARQKTRGKRDAVISLNPPFASRPLDLLASTSSSPSSSSSSSCSYRILFLLLLVLLIVFFFFTSRESLARSGEKGLSVLSLLFSQLSCRESRQLRRSRIRPSIGTKQAHPLKRYATSLSTHGERERFTSRQYWSNVKPVWKPARKREGPLRSAYVFASSSKGPYSRVLVMLVTWMSNWYLPLDRTLGVKERWDSGIRIWWRRNRPVLSFHRLNTWNSWCKCHV